MKSSIISAEQSSSVFEKSRVIDRIARSMVLKRLESIKHGQLTVLENGQATHFGKATEEFPVHAVLTVNEQRFYGEIAFSGTIGAGEAYMQGLWSCDDLTSLVRLMLRNRDIINGMDSGLGYLAAPLHKFFHWLNRNSIKGSRRNISAHYDLGNDLFGLFLDDTMMYSSGIFKDSQTTMKQASIAKLDRICEKLELGPSDHVLEIGTGWGGFALHAAKQYGCRVTTTTISEQQFALAQKRVKEAGLEDRITLLLRDYRELEGTYDKLVSIEMIEAIGHRFFDTYFAKCSELLKPNGMMLLQAITIADQQYDSAKGSVDFIQRHIFPGSCLPSVAAMTDSLARKTDLRLFNLEDIGPHYATTLRHWRERFFANVKEIRECGYSDAFIKMWEFYLCYCEGGFVERSIGDVQMLLTKPFCRRPSYLPA